MFITAVGVKKTFENLRKKKHTMPYSKFVHFFPAVSYFTTCTTLEIYHPITVSNVPNKDSTKCREKKT